MTGERPANSTLRPDLKEAEDLFHLGSRCLDANDFPSAERCFREVVRIAPDRAEAYSNLGAALENAGVLGEAESCYLRALALEPASLHGYLNLGALRVNQKRWQEARGDYDRALELFPESAAAWSNLGVLHACLKQDAEAEACCRTSLFLDANYTKARFNLSYLQLRQGRFEEGWQSLEARPWYLDLIARISGPRWQGENLTGKALLIGSEGGYGDMIQFCRYTALLKGQGAVRIGVICHPVLKRLFATLPGVDVVVALGETIPEPGWDFWTLPLTLPLYCGTRLDSIPAPIPYLRAVPEVIQDWRARIPTGVIRVGLAWRGNPQFENDAERSLPLLQLLAPLTGAKGVHFISLQKGVGEDEAAQPPPGTALFDPSPWIEDFSDAAGLMANLDLVISVDTAAAHLAGALGNTCWVLLPHHKTDWRWLTEREDSPWYPGTMRLFRQSGGQGWASVIEEVAVAFHHFVQEWHASKAAQTPSLQAGMHL